MRSAAALAVILPILLGCATQAYPGAERPEEQLSRIYFFSRAPIESEERVVDQVKQGFFDMGLKVLPGPHTVEASFTLKDRECESVPYEYCFEKVARGWCRGTFSSAAGSDYSVELTGVGQQGYMSISDKASGDVAGAGSCETRSVDVE